MRPSTDYMIGCVIFLMGLASVASAVIGSIKAHSFRNYWIGLSLFQKIIAGGPLALLALLVVFAITVAILEAWREWASRDKQQNR